MKRLIHDEIDRLEASGLRRTLRDIDGPQGASVVVNGRRVILLCSNDYLGLANHPLVKQAAIDSISACGFGAGASRLVSGNMEAHRMLEDRIARFKSTESALVFNSGYNANLGCITALAGRDTAVFSDRLNHASIVDACLLSRAEVKRYPNRDVDSLERLLKKTRLKKRLIVTDGVFSMDGTIAPLPDIVSLLERYDATLIVDDAHATGVLGQSGRGTLEHFNISHPSVIQMGTLGKAFGSFGAFIAGDKDLIELLINKARPFIYTTALPPSVCAAASKAIDLVDEDPGLLVRLWERRKQFHDGLSECGLDTMGSSTPIIPIFVGETKKAVEASTALLDRGVFIQAIRPPTVPDGTSRLRATVTAIHSKEEIDTAVSAIKEALNA